MEVSPLVPTARLTSADGREIFVGDRLSIDSDFTVLTRVNCGNTDAVFNPFTQTPVQGTNYALGRSFGTAITPQGFQLPWTSPPFFVLSLCRSGNTVCGS